MDSESEEYQPQSTGSSGTGAIATVAFPSFTSEPLFVVQRPPNPDSTAYQRYCDEQRPLILREKPESTPGDIFFILRTGWDRMTEEEKRSYREDRMPEQVTHVTYAGHAANIGVAYTTDIAPRIEDAQPLPSTPAAGGVSAASSATMEQAIPLRFTIETCIRLQSSQPELSPDRVQAAIVSGWQALSSSEKRQYFGGTGGTEEGAASSAVLSHSALSTEPSTLWQVNASKLETCEESNITTSAVPVPGFQFASRASTPPFLRYCKEHRKRVRAANPLAMSAQIKVLLENEWRSLSHEEKKKYANKTDESAPASSLEPGPSSSSSIPPAPLPSASQSSSTESPAITGMGQLAASFAGFGLSATPSIAPAPPHGPGPTTTASGFVFSSTTTPGSSFTTRTVSGTIAGSAYTRNITAAPVPFDHPRISEPPMVRPQPTPLQTPFQRFCAKNRQRIEEANPTATSSDIWQLLAQAWKNLSDNEKQSYGNDLGLALRPQPVPPAPQLVPPPSAEPSQTGPSSSSSGLSSIPQSSSTESAAGTGVGQLAASFAGFGLSATRQPAPLQSPFQRFCAETRQQFQEANPTASFNDIWQLQMNAWMNLGENEKKKYANDLRAIGLALAPQTSAPPIPQPVPPQVTTGPAVVAPTSPSKSEDTIPSTSAAASTPLSSVPPGINIDVPTKKYETDVQAYFQKAHPSMSAEKAKAVMLEQWAKLTVEDRVQFHLDALRATLTPSALSGPSPPPPPPAAPVNPFLMSSASTQPAPPAPAHPSAGDPVPAPAPAPPPPLPHTVPTVPGPATNPGFTANHKRAPSPYIIFCQENRQRIKDANPTATFGEIGKLLGEAWANLSENERQTYKRNEIAPPVQPALQFGVTGFGQSTGGFGQSTGGFGQSTGGFGQSTGGFGQSTGGFGQSTGGFGQSTGGFGPSTGGFGQSTGGFGQSTGGIGPSTGGFGQSTGGFGQSTGGFGQSTGGFGPSTGGFGQSTGGFGQSTGGFGQSTGGFGQSTGGFAQLGQSRGVFGQFGAGSGGHSAGWSGPGQSTGGFAQPTGFGQPPGSASSSGFTQSSFGSGACSAQSGPSAGFGAPPQPGVTPTVTTFYPPVRQFIPPFIRFSNANRDRIRAANPTASFLDIARLLKEAWDNLSDNEREQYNEESLDTSSDAQQAIRVTGFGPGFGLVAGGASHAPAGLVGLSTAATGTAALSAPVSAPPSVPTDTSTIVTKTAAEVSHVVVQGGLATATIKSYFGDQTPAFTATAETTPTPRPTFIDVTAPTLTFLKETKSQLKVEHPDKSPLEIDEMMKEMWRQLPVEDRMRAHVAEREGKVLEQVQLTQSQPQSGEPVFSPLAGGAPSTAFTASTSSDSSSTPSSTTSGGASTSLSSTTTPGLSGLGQGSLSAVFGSMGETSGSLLAQRIKASRQQQSTFQQSAAGGGGGLFGQQNNSGGGLFSKSSHGSTGANNAAFFQLSAPSGPTTFTGFFADSRGGTSAVPTVETTTTGGGGTGGTGGTSSFGVSTTSFGGFTFSNPIRQAVQGGASAIDGSSSTITFGSSSSFPAKPVHTNPITSFAASFTPPPAAAPATVPSAFISEDRPLFEVPTIMDNLFGGRLQPHKLYALSGMPQCAHKSIEEWHWEDVKVRFQKGFDTQGGIIRVVIHEQHHGDPPVLKPFKSAASEKLLY